MFGFLESGGDHNGYIRALEFLLPVLCAVSVMPTYARPLFLLSSAVVPKVSRALRSVREIENAARGCVVERQSRLEKGDDVDSDVLNSLFNIVQKKGPEVDFGMTEITVEVYVALFVCLQSPSGSQFSDKPEALQARTPPQPQSPPYYTIS